MGFFEDHLSAIGRGLDAACETIGDWFRSRARAVSDRRGHARRFEDIRDRIARSADQARSGLGESVDQVKHRWRRRDSDERGSTVRVAAALGILLGCAGLVTLGRAWITPTPREASMAERDLLRRVQTRQQSATPGNSGLDHWITRP